MELFRSASFWFVVVVITVLAGGLITGFLYRKPVMKPTLAARKNETEADIKEELGE